MKISVNGEVYDVTATYLADLLNELGYQDAIVATAVNACFVSVTQREQTVLSEGDCIEILAPMQGG